MDNKWIIGIDLDGTFNTDFDYKLNKSYPHPYNVEIVKQLQELGHEIVFVTGRNWAMTREVYEECGLKSPVINSAGGHVWNPVDETFDREVYLIKSKIIDDIINDENVIDKINFLLYDDWDKSYIYQSGSRDEIDFKIWRWGKDAIIPLDNTRVDIDVESLIIYLNIDDNEYEDFSKYIKEKYGSLVDVSDWGKKNKGYYSFEFNTKEINKGIAFNRLAEKLNIPKERRMVIGDGDNDTLLFKHVENSVCMINGKDSLKSISKHITKIDNNNGGVGHFLKEYFNL